MSIPIDLDPPLEAGGDEGQGQADQQQQPKYPAWFAKYRPGGRYYQGQNWQWWGYPSKEEWDAEIDQIEIEKVGEVRRREVPPPPPAPAPGEILTHERFDPWKQGSEALPFGPAQVDDDQAEEEEQEQEQEERPAPRDLVTIESKGE